MNQIVKFYPVLARVVASVVTVIVAAQEVQASVQDAQRFCKQSKKGQ